MARWGVPVPPHDDAEEKTELALMFDDAEFQHDPEEPRTDPWRRRLRTAGCRGGVRRDHRVGPEDGFEHRFGRGGAVRA